MEQFLKQLMAVLSVALIALPYYQNTNPALAAISRRAIDEALADHKHAT